MTPVEHQSDTLIGGSVRIRHQVLQAGGWAVAGFVLEKGIGFLQLVILTRLLLPGDFGLMAASAAVLMAIQTFSELGLEPAVIAKPHVTDDDLRVAWTLSVLRGVLLAAGVFALADAIASALRMTALAPFLRIHAVGVVLQSLHSPALFVLLKKLDLKRRVSFDLCRRVVECTATVGLAWWWHSAWALVGGQLVAFAFGSLTSYVVAPCPVRWSLHRPALRSLWSYGRYQNLTAWFLFTVMSGGDFVIGRLLGIDALGQFQLAMAIPTMIGIRAMSVISQISLPTYALLQRDRPAVLRALSLQMSLTGVIVVPVAIAVAIGAPWLVPTLFGPAWTAAVDPLRVLCLFAAAAAFCSVMASFHCGANHPELQTKIWAVMCACYVTAVIPLSLSWGLVGAAWALSGTFVLGVMLHLQATVRLLGDDVKPAFEPVRWAAAIGCLVAAGLSIGQAMPSLWVAQWAAGFCGLLGIGLYGWHLWTRESHRLRLLWGS
ncbi:MAG: oligosaccharide flippase family protein [Nitrospira sp.]